MKKYKYRTARLFHRALWGVITIASFSLLIKCIGIFGTDSLSQSTQSLETNLVSAACNYMIQSNMPILGYIANKDQNGNNNLILNTLVGVFPINRYVAAANDNINDNLIENQKDTLLFANGSNLLFDNDVYRSLILQGIKNNRTEAGIDKIDDNQSTDVNTNNSSLTDDSSLVSSDNSLPGIMPIDIISGEVYLEYEDATDTKENTNSEAEETLGTIKGEYFTLDQLLNRKFLYNNFYIIDSATVVTDELFDAKVLLGKSMIMKANSDKPQILIYHTHSQEAYCDSRDGVEEDTVVGVGTYLTELLTDKYGFNVIHDKSQYDLMEGYIERNLAYNYANLGIAKILEQNPSIEVVIDLHRDGAAKRVSKVNGKDTAKLMLFNGLSRNSKGEIAYLKNPYLQDNLAFSLQLQLKGRELYPGLMYKNYLHAYRYNMNYREKSLLVENGTNLNTLEEAMNAMAPLSEVLYEVLRGGS